MIPVLGNNHSHSYAIEYLPVRSGAFASGLPYLSVRAINRLSLAVRAKVVTPGIRVSRPPETALLPSIVRQNRSRIAPRSCAAIKQRAQLATPHCVFHLAVERSPETTHIDAGRLVAGITEKPSWVAFLLSKEICCWRYFSS